ncbi:leucine-rich repeat domain-containing protein, partial [Ruminococcus flavefaciens]
MLRNRLIAGLLSAVMCTTAVMPNQVSDSAGREANAASGKEKAGSGDYDIKSTNSLGNFLAGEAAQKNVSDPLAESSDASQFQITSLEFDSETGMVQIASNQSTDAKIVVSFVDDETSECVLSVETSVEAGKLVNSEVKADISKLPKYYAVKAQLFNDLNRPVGKEYVLSRYTKAVQEIIATDITAFDEEQVVNLDEDDTTNFLVLNEDTVKAESSEEQNTLVSADYDNNVFVFDNADETISSLREGESLFIQPDDQNIIAVNVENIEKDGDKVTVSGNGAIDDMFDFIKIETDGDLKNASVDTSCADEGMSFPNTDENGNPIFNDDGSLDFEYEIPEYNAEFKLETKKVFNINSILDPQTVDPRKLDPYEGTKGEFQRNLSGTVTISASLNFYKSFTTTEIQFALKVTPAITFTIGYSSSNPKEAFTTVSSKSAASIYATIAKFVIPTSIPAVVVDIEPRLFADFVGNMTLTLKWENVLGFTYKDGEFTNDSKLNPEKTVDLSLKIYGEIYAGLELTPKVEIFTKALASVGIDFKAGIRISAEADLGKMYDQLAQNADEPADKVIIDSGKGDSYHACKFCMQAKVDFVVKIKLTLIVLRKEKKWDLLTVEVPLKWAYFHYSLEDGWGWGECNYNRYRTTFMVLNKADGGFIPAVVKLNDKEVTVGGSGATFYCLPGSYDYSVTYDGKTLESGRVTVNNSSQDLEFKEDVKLDDDGNFKEYTHGDTKSVTGSPVTKATTAKRIIVTETLPAIKAEKDQIIAETGALGDNISYMLYPNGYLYVGGFGEMYDFSSSPFRDPSLVKNVIIENDGEIITNIGNGVFNGCKNMESINMPQTIKSIGKNAFRGCASLSEVSYDEYDYAKEKVIEVKYPEGKLVMPKAIETVGEYAFSGCASFTDIVIPETISELTSYVFSGTGIESISVPENIIKINDYVFSDCTSLKTAVISEATETIGYHIFSGCSAIKDITIPYIGHSLEKAEAENSKQEFTDFFYGGNDADFINVNNTDGWGRWIPKSLDSITVTSGTRVPNYAFYNIKSVKNIYIPKTMKTIGNYSYANCISLENANIPEGVESLGLYAFSNCCSTAMKTVEFPKSLTSISNYAFSECGGLTNITVPKTVKTMGDYVFSKCSALEKVVIYGGADGIGHYIFSECKSLADLTLPFAGYNAKTIDEPNVKCELSGMFLNGNEKDYYSITNTDGWNRWIPKSLKKITVLSGKRLCDYAFYRFGGVEKFEISKTVTEIGNYTFAGCASITKDYIPESVEYIGNHAFEGCTSISDGKIKEGVISIGNYAFSNCSSAALKTISFPKTLTSIGDHAFSGCKGLTSINVPNTVKKIGEFAFSDCSAVKTAVIYGGEEGIGNFAFSGCKSLADMTLPFAGHSLAGVNAENSKQEIVNYFHSGDDKDYYNFCDTNGWGRYVPNSLKKITILGGKRIPNYAFRNLSSVESIIIPKSITEIGDHAYDNCTSMTEIYMPEGVKSIGYSAFGNCSNAAVDTVKFPTTLENIGNYAFSGCSSIKKISVPKTVKTIGNFVFNDCSGLVTAEILGSGTSIGYHIFSGCKSLASMTIPFAGYALADVNAENSSQCIADYFNNGNEEDYYNITNPSGWGRWIPKALKKITVLGGTRIPNYAFYRLRGVTDIVIPDEIAYIGNYAFASCSELKSAPMPSSLISIGVRSFENCSSTSFKGVEFPENLTSIGSYAFSDCNEITSINVPATVLNLGDYVFNSCDKLKNAEIYGGSNGIGVFIFNACCSLETLTLPFAGFSLDDVNKDGSSQYVVDYFNDGNEEDYYHITNAAGWGRWIPKSLKTINIVGGKRIPNYAFYRFGGVEKINVPDEIISFGNHSFEACNSLKNAPMPKSLVTIGDSAFNNCSAADFDSIEFADSVESIGAYAFANCYSLSSVTIPETVISVNDRVFENCTSLKSAEFIGENKTIGNFLFNKCKALESLTVPFVGSSLATANADGSTYQLSELFLDGNEDDYYRITNASGWSRWIPKSLTTVKVNGGKKLPKYSFYRMSGIKDVYLPKIITTIADNAFNGCSGIENVFYPSTRADWDKNVTIGVNNEAIDGKVRFLNDNGVYDTTTTTSGTVTTTSTSKTTTSATTSKTTTSTSKTTTSATTS